MDASVSACRGCARETPDDRRRCGVLRSAWPQRPSLRLDLSEIGTPATPGQIAALDIDVRPDGTGLPPGGGTAREGAPIYAQKCAACHGANGEGGTADVLVGAEPKNSAPFGPEYERWRGARPDVPFTIGNYWRTRPPYSTTCGARCRQAHPALSLPMRPMPSSHGCSRRTRSSRRAT